MQQSTTGQRALAITAGLVFLAGTLGILFEDVIKGAPPALKHGLTLVTLAGTIMTGHLAADAWRRWRHSFLAAIGFSLVFLCGTGLVVYSSVGRQAATSVQTTGQIEEANESRVAIKQARAQAQAMLDAAYIKFAKQCETGKGPRCEGIEATIEVYTAAVAGHDAKLDKIGVQQPAAPEAEQFAEIAAVVFGAEKAKVKAAALLVQPFLITLFLEFGTIVSLGYGFHAKRPRVQFVPPPAATMPANDDAPTAYSEADALQDIRTEVSAGRHHGVVDYGVRWGVSKGEASKRITQFETEGLIGCERDGKSKRVTHVKLRLVRAA